MTKQEAAGKLHYLLCLFYGFAPDDIIEALRVAIKTLDPNRSLNEKKI